MSEGSDESRKWKAQKTMIGYDNDSDDDDWQAARDQEMYDLGIDATDIGEPFAGSISGSTTESEECFDEAHFNWMVYFSKIFAHTCIEDALSVFAYQRARDMWLQKDKEKKEFMDKFRREKVYKGDFTRSPRR